MGIPDAVVGPLVAWALAYLGALVAQWGAYASVTGLLAFLLWREKVDHRATRTALTRELSTCNDKRVSESREVIAVLEASTAAREHRMAVDERMIAVLKRRQSRPRRPPAPPP